MDASERDIAEAERIVVLYHGPDDDALLDVFAQAQAESALPAAAAPGPVSLVYYERGEVMERLAPAPGVGLDRDDVEAFFAKVDALQERYRWQNGKLRLDRLG